jgi:sigma-B regulation protein RsbU (phosphoserine phosphatase)
LSQDHKWRRVDRRRVTEQLSFPLLLPSSGEYVLADRRSGHDRRKLGIVSSQAVFEGVPFSVVESLVELCELRRLEKGERLLAPHQLNAHLFLVLKGNLKVHVDRPDSPSDIDIVPGEFTGEVSIIDGKPATAFVIASEPSVVLAIPELRFWGEFMRYPRIAKNFIRLFAQRFRERNKLIKKAIEEHLRFEALERELEIAAQIQASMLPKDFNLSPQVDVFATMRPARHVGGDFYDVFSLDEERFYVAVGDVAGKGVPASLFMIRAMTILRSEMLKKNPVDVAITAMNKALCRDNDGGMFVTLGIVELNKRTGKGRYVSAGHNPVAISRAGGTFSFLPKQDGILLGIEKGATYEGVELSLSRHDTLVLYTDGITEAMNRDKAFFTEQRLIDSLNAITTQSSEQLGMHVINDVKKFADGATQADDLTLAIVRFGE